MVAVMRHHGRYDPGCARPACTRAGCELPGHDRRGRLIASRSRSQYWLSARRGSPWSPMSSSTSSARSPITARRSPGPQRTPGVRAPGGPRNFSCRVRRALAAGLGPARSPCGEHGTRVPDARGGATVLALDRVSPLAAGAIDNLIREYLDAWTQNVSPAADALECVTDLAADYRLTIVTNTHDLGLVPRACPAIRPGLRGRPCRLVRRGRLAQAPPGHLRGRPPRPRSGSRRHGIHRRQLGSRRRRRRAASGCTPSTWGAPPPSTRPLR